MPRRHDLRHSPQFKFLEAGMWASFYECRRCKVKILIDPEINEGWEIEHQCDLRQWAREQKRERTRRARKRERYLRLYSGRPFTWKEFLG